MTSTSRFAGLDLSGRSANIARIRKRGSIDTSATIALCCASRVNMQKAAAQCQPSLPSIHCQGTKVKWNQKIMVALKIMVLKIVLATSTGPTHQQVLVSKQASHILNQLRFLWILIEGIRMEGQELPRITTIKAISTISQRPLALRDRSQAASRELELE